MQRRGFLKALAGVSAGLAGGGAAVAAAKTQASSGGTLALAAPAKQEPAEPLLNIPLATHKSSITADTSGFSGSIADAQRMLTEMLKECRAISYSHAIGAYVAGRLTVIYHHAPDSPRTPIDDKVDEILGGQMKPASVNVSSRCDKIDVLDSGSFWEYRPISIGKQVTEIEVEYVVT